MPKITRPRLLLVTLLVGSALGIIFAYSYVEGFFIRWKSMGPPPSGAYRILDYGPSLVVVEANNGLMFEKSISLNGNEWSEVNEIEGYFLEFQEYNFVLSWTPRPPESVADHIELTTPYGPTFEYVSYSILSDGEVWYWHHTFGEWDMGAYCLYPILGIMVGAIMWFLIVELKRES